MSGPRVLGWDILRGLCALSVMLYHLMAWQSLAHLSTLATYGVYLFFILSGASLTYVYGDQTLRSVRGVLHFLAARWFRLAPLYVLVCLLFLCMLAARNGQWADAIGWRLLLNASFAFGLHDPAIWSLAVGGWSLGIEFVFYLAMPLIVWVLPWRAGRSIVLCALVIVQWLWIQATVGAHGLLAASTAYHQVPAFAAYFFAGCLLGYSQRQVAPGLPLWVGITVWMAMGGLLVAGAPAVEGDELLGGRGAILPLACVLAVWVSGRVVLTGRAVPLARWLGDITYGTYLLHPLLFFSWAWFVLPYMTPTAAEELALGWRLMVLVGVTALSCALAGASEQFLERPLRALGRRWLSTQRPVV